MDGNIYIGEKGMEFRFRALRLGKGTEVWLRALRLGKRNEALLSVA